MRGVGRTVIVLLVTILMVLVLALGACGVLAWGPSSEWTRRFVCTFDESSAMKFVPRIYLPEATVQAYLHPAAGTSGEPEDDLFIELPFEDGTQPVSQTADPVQAASPGQQPGEAAQNGEWLEVINMKGPSFKGKMMIIHDPSKVIVGTLDAYGAAYHGLYLYEFIEKYNAIGGTNAGGFYDPNGVGNGGTPDGLVIRNGQIAWGSATGWYINVIGFDANNVLHVGDMSGQQALDLGMTSAVSFSPGPVLVKDGVKRTGLGGGMNPRTCIGQRQDGTILLMVLEGRKPDSLGATYDDIAQIMYDYGAVNAANLDGGSSSLMYYKGEQITRGSNIIGMRQMSTAILVLN
jgi:exopolysaccharide biosynthesis protein